MTGIKFFTAAEAGLIFSSTVKKDMRLLFRFLFRTGARISEALALRPQDVHDNHVLLKTLKQNRPMSRNIPVEPAFIAELRNLAASQATRQGEPIWDYTRAHAHNVLCYSIKAAGLEKRKRALHAFRHGFAKHCLDNGVDLRDLQRYLGHASIAMTSKYLSITDDHMKRLTRIDFEPRQRGIFD